MTEWVSDDRGNECSVEYFGSRVAAQAALDSLKNCRNCTNCSGCSDCSGCSGKSSETGDFAPPGVPSIPDIHQRVLAAITENKLKMDNWHTCSTTHCRAGWMVHLAGEDGYALERFYGSGLAAQLICRQAGFPISPVRFYDNDKDALVDIKKMAGADPTAP